MKEKNKKKVEKDDFWKRIGKYVKDKIDCCIE